LIGSTTETRERRGSRRLLLRVGALALVVGLVAAGVAFLSVAGDCAGPPVDVACRKLTALLSERIGVLAALATAVGLLTMAGIAKLDRERPAYSPRRRQRP